MKLHKLPDPSGHFGKFGGKYVIETLMPALKELEKVYDEALNDPQFEKDLKYYLKNYGKVFHHNVDKGILVGGKSKPEFGGGIIEEPIEIIVVGRAVIEIKRQDKKKCIPIDSISINAMKNCIKNPPPTK